MTPYVWEASKLGQWIRIGMALLLLGGALWILANTVLGSQLWQLLLDPSAERIAEILDKTTLWLPMVFICLMILHTLMPVPAELLAFAAGMALGPLWGFVTIWIGAMLGAYLGFFLARALGQPFVHHLVKAERLERLFQQLQHADIPVLLAARLLPVVSFNLINYALGLSPLGWWRFTWTTGVGIVPVTALVVIFGAHLKDWHLLLLLLMVVVLLGLGGYRVMRSRCTASRPQHAVRQ